MKSVIVAYDEKRGIGAENDLLWKRDLKSDLAHFKELTLGTSMIMGRNTFESIGRALPGRQTIVLSLSRHAIEAADVTVVNTIDAAVEAATYEDISIIGGGQIYRQTLDIADRIYATEVKATFNQADVFFPTLDTNKWQETDRQIHYKDELNKYDFDFVTFERTTQQ